MERFSRSWALLKESYAILKATPELTFFPIISGIVSLFVAASFFVPLAVTSGMMRGGHHIVATPIHYVVLFLFYLASYFVVIFFNAGLVSCAYDSLTGEPTNYKRGLANAAKHIGPIFIWSVIAATVGTILRYIGERTGIVGQIVVGILGFAWTLITYFVVPAMVIENFAPFGALKRSGGMLRGTWGEQIIANFSIGTATGVLILIAFIPCVLAIVCLIGGLYILAIPLVILSVLLIIAIAILSATLSGIYNTALYIYASSGVVPQAFSSDFIQGAFRQKQGNKFFGR